MFTTMGVTLPADRAILPVAMAQIILLAAAAIRAVARITPLATVAIPPPTALLNVIARA